VLCKAISEQPESLSKSRRLCIAHGLRKAPGFYSNYRKQTRAYRRAYRRAYSGSDEGKLTAGTRYVMLHGSRYKEVTLPERSSAKKASTEKASTEKASMRGGQ
jgi:hypothetical protein